MNNDILHIMNHMARSEQGKCMVIQNKKCRVEITTDDTYTVDSADNRHYDVVLNPCRYQRCNLSKTFSIHIELADRELSVALIGSFLADDHRCAVLDRDVLLVLQDDWITQIDITDGSIIKRTEVPCLGGNFEIYEVKTGYILHGETEITMLDRDLNKKWSFAGKDIFASVTGKVPFEIRENSICLYDFEDNFYQLDFDGKLIG